MQKVYKLSILYYLAFILLLITSAIMLFENKIGFSATSILEYYLGSEEKFIPSKGYIGVLKIILPHIFVFGLLSMVLLHFLVFTKHKYKKSTISCVQIVSWGIREKGNKLGQPII